MRTQITAALSAILLIATPAAAVSGGDSGCADFNVDAYDTALHFAAPGFSATVVLLRTGAGPDQPLLNWYADAPVTAIHGPASWAPPDATEYWSGGVEALGTGWYTLCWRGGLPALPDTAVALTGGPSDE